MEIKELVTSKSGRRKVAAVVKSVIVLEKISRGQVQGTYHL